MIVKTYRTYFLKSLSFDIPGENEGEEIHILFQGGIQVDSTAKYVTSNPYIQKKLEESRRFDYDYFLEDTKIVSDPSDEAPAEKEAPSAPKKEEEKPLTDVKDIKRFHNIVEMRSAMAELGFEGVQEMNYAQLKSAASKEGYDFQIQK